MRDLILLCLLPILIYFAWKKPFIGLALWLWTSLVPTQIWGYGLATSVRWNMLFAAITILSFLVSKKKHKFKSTGLFLLVIILFIQATFSTMLHIGNASHVWQEWDYMLKSIIFFIFVVLIVHKRVHIEALLWACVLSISVRAGLQGISVIASGGSHIAKGISPTFNDNNLSALAALMCLPMMFYLFTQYKKIFVFKWILLGLILTNVLYILGSDSRGGFLGLLVLAGYFFMKSKNKLPIMIAMMAVSIIALSFMEADWFNRMSSIKDANEDSSFMGRVISWKLALLLAMENPILGGGFDAASHPPTWHALAYNFYKVNFIPSPDPHQIHVAHSIYFQVLGDLGFVGLTIFLLLLKNTYSSFNKVGTNTNIVWLQSLGVFMTLSVLAFSVSGAALSAAYNEIFFMLIGLSIAINRLHANEQQGTIK